MKKILNFKTDEEAATFWETLGFEEYHRDTKEAEIKFIRRRKKTVAVRLDPDGIKSLKLTYHKDSPSINTLSCLHDQICVEVI
jgi:hypothetical protein